MDTVIFYKKQSFMYIKKGELSMRLRKRIISTVLAACMAVTILPAGMPVKVSAAEETGETKIPEETEPGIVMPEFQEMPQILENGTVPEWTGEEVAESGNVNEGIGLLADEEINKNRISRKYIPTGETSFSFALYVLEEAVNEEDGYIVYLFDKDDKIAAKSVKPEKADYNNKFYFENIYRTRELEAGEVLYIGYSNSNGVINKLKDITVTVTDQPYIINTYSGNRDFIENSYGYYYYAYGGGLYPGSDGASVLTISGYNIDFSKLGLKLRDSSTNEIVAESESYVECERTKAYYCIRWNDGIEQYDKNYVIEYSYSDNAKSVVHEEAAGSYHNYVKDKSIIWNPKGDTIECYNKEIPAGTAVSYEIKDDEYGSQADICASGSSIIVSDSHSIIIDLKGRLLSYSSHHRFKLTIEYEEEGQEKSWEEEFYNYNNYYNGDDITWIGVNGFYTTDDNEIEISAFVYPDEVMENESKFTDTFKVNIYKYYNNDDIVGEVELKLKKEGSRILYSGTYKGNLELGAYGFSFSPDGEHILRYCFHIYDKDKLYLFNQSNNIASGEIILQFGTYKMAEWYFKNPDNLNKIKIKILDIEGKEIGTYKYSDGDFIIGDISAGYTYVGINFIESIKQELKDLYYCDIYFYYNDGNGNDTTPEYLGTWRDNGTGQVEYEKFYEYTNMGKYIKGETNNWLQMGNYRKGNIYYGIHNYYTIKGFNTINGNNSAFPAKLTITDWYSLKPIKEITINEPLHVFTESELEGLSSDKIYNFFLKGADGTADSFSGYIFAGEVADDGDNKPDSPTPSPTPAPGKPSGGSIGSYIPSINNDNSTVAQPTATPEVSATPAPTVEPTNAPTAVPTIQPTAIPEPTNAPVQTAPPVDVQEPDNQITGNYTPEPEKKTKLELKKKKITLKKGQKAKIKITSKLNTSVTYKSLKPSVATVSKKGVITAKKAGKAVITVKANGQVKKVEVTVKQVKKVEEKAVKNSSVKLGKDFKIAKASVTLKKGGKLTIKKASGLSGKVTFRSLDKKIASVSVNGVVKAKKKGKTAILIKNGKKTIKLKIVVKR